ncbi:MAG: SsrA-binding protein SmpB [Coriobacteriaceae bacterium]|nr:SsrA-binding protein SmpB [Coriobacteriaceae bacterium]MDO4889838.1 SsrA-binding protein SmpB [Coriobacteriaceae bacterium]
MAKGKAHTQASRDIARNRKALHEYEVVERFEAGIELTGTEVKSLRENNCQLTDAFVLIRKGQAWLHNLHISPYSHGSYNNPDPDRKRRLLLHRKQIMVLSQKVKERGLAIVPLRMYYSEKNLVKVEIALARGKKLHDKRQSMAERDVKRDIERAMKQRYR